MLSGLTKYPPRPDPFLLLFSLSPALAQPQSNETKRSYDKWACILRLPTSAAVTHPPLRPRPMPHHPIRSYPIDSQTHMYRAWSSVDFISSAYQL